MGSQKNVIRRQFRMATLQSRTIYERESSKNKTTLIIAYVNVCGYI